MELEEPSSSGEIKRLQRGINDLVSVLALPAIWTGSEASLVAATLLDALVRILSLDFAYVRVKDPTEGSPKEWARFGGGLDRGIPPDEVGKALQPFLSDDRETGSLRIAHPLADGTLSIVVFHLGLREGVGEFAACSRRQDFPTDIEKLVLQVATNQAAIGLEIETEESLQINLDGEPITGTRFRFELLPRRVPMKLPPDCPLVARGAAQ